MPPSRTQKRREAEPSAQSGLWSPPATKIESASLPGLIPIHDQELRKQSLTHKTYTAETADEQGAPRSLAAELASFKRLETLGDAELNCAVLRTLMMKWPEWPSAALNAVKEVIVSNNTLGYLGKYYQLDLDLRVGPKAAEKGLGRAQGTLADAFEAYIGALTTQCNQNHCHDVFQSWVDQLVSSTVFPDIEKIGHARCVSLLSKAQGGKSQDGKSQISREVAAYLDPFGRQSVTPSICRGRAIPSS